MQRGTREVFWMLEMFYAFIGWWVHKGIHLSRLTEMHALNGGILMYVSYISIKLIILKEG